MKRLIIVLIFISNAFKVCAQDALFVNNHQSLVYLNPSFAGSNGFVRNQFSYRNQWPNLSGTYVTHNNSFDAYINKIKGGISLSVFSDDQARGTLRKDGINIGYAHHFNLFDNKLKIIPSLQIGYYSQTLDKGRLNFGAPINMRSGIIWTSSNNPISRKDYYDISSGILINSRNSFFGVSVFHINQPDEGLIGFSKLPYRFNIHASHNYFTSENLLYNFFIQYTQQSSFQMLSLKVKTLFFKRFLLTGGINNSSSIILGTGYRHHLFCISIDYDATLSKLSGNTAGSWELNISYTLRNKENRKELTCFENW